MTPPPPKKNHYAFTILGGSITVSEVALEFWRPLKYGLNFAICFSNFECNLQYDLDSEILDCILRSSRILNQLQKLLIIVLRLNHSFVKNEIEKRIMEEPMQKSLVPPGFDPGTLE